MNERRRVIIEAAMKLFARKGFHATSIQEIANESGIAKGSIYNYFNSKDELILSIFKHYFGMIYKKLKEVEQNKSLSPKEIFTEQIRVHFREMQNHKEFLMMHMREQAIQRNEEIHQLFKENHSKLYKLFVESISSIYGERVRNFEVDCTIMFLGMIREFLLISFLEQKLDIDRIGQYLVGRLDAIVTSLQEEEAPLVTKEAISKLDRLHESQLQQHKKVITDSLASLREKALQLDSTIESEKVLSSLTILEKEIQNLNPTSQTVIIESLILYLQNLQRKEFQQELAEISTRVKKILNED